MCIRDGYVWVRKVSGCLQVILSIRQVNALMLEFVHDYDKLVRECVKLVKGYEQCSITLRQQGDVKSH